MSSQELRVTSVLKWIAWCWLVGPIWLLSGLSSAAELVIPGGGNPEFVLRQLAQAFALRQPAHKISVPASIGSSGGLREIREGKAVLARIGRPLSDAEKAQGLVALPFGRDAVVFVGGAGVTVRGVSSAQMVDVFAGRIVDWRDLGGAEAPIRVIGREVSDSSRVAMSTRIPALRTMSLGPQVKMALLDTQTLDLLDRFGASLAILNQSALFAARTPLVRLALDGVAPDLANLTSGRYPVALEFSLVHRASDALPGVARDFIDFVRSAEGTAILKAHGVVPLASAR